MGGLRRSPRRGRQQREGASAPGARGRGCRDAPAHRGGSVALGTGSLLRRWRSLLGGRRSLLGGRPWRGAGLTAALRFPSAWCPRWRRRSVHAGEGKSAACTLVGGESILLAPRAHGRQAAREETHSASARWRRGAPPGCRLRCLRAATRAANSPVLVGTLLRSRSTRIQRLCASCSARLRSFSPRLLLPQTRVEGVVQAKLQYALHQRQGARARSAFSGVSGAAASAASTRRTRAHCSRSAGGAEARPCPRCVSMVRSSFASVTFALLQLLDRARGQQRIRPRQPLGVGAFRASRSCPGRRPCCRPSAPAYRSGTRGSRVVS